MCSQCGKSAINGSTICHFCGSAVIEINYDSSSFNDAVNNAIGKKISDEEKKEDKIIKLKKMLRRLIFVLVISILILTTILGALSGRYSSLVNTLGKMSMSYFILGLVFIGISFVIGSYISCIRAFFNYSLQENYFPTIFAVLLTIGISLICMWGIILGFSKLFDYSIPIW